MAGFDPFEPAPTLAVAVSGGPDSMALTLLLDDWVRQRGGYLRAFTVDHGLRPEAAAEAVWVGEQLASRGIAHEVLTWRPTDGGKTTQADAREGRFAALQAACRRYGILHLVLAHHRADQAETCLLRVAAASGVDGLAAMSAERRLATLRLLRPLLDIPKARLQATLVARGQSWLADPSNADTRYRRVRLRCLMPELNHAGLSEAALAAAARTTGRLRAVMDGFRNALAAEAVTIWPVGYAVVQAPVMLRAAPELAMDVLGRVLRTIGGAAHPPRRARLERLVAALRAAPVKARTLGGCRIVPRRGVWLVVREPGRMPLLHPLNSAMDSLYDNRYRITVAVGVPSDVTVGPLGVAGWATLTQVQPGLRAHALPPPVRPALLAVRDDAGIREVPHLPWRRADSGPTLRCHAFAPLFSLGDAGFTVAQNPRHII